MAAAIPEYLVIDQDIYMFLDISENNKPQCFWDVYKEHYNQPLKQVIIEFKQKVLITYGVYLYGKEFKHQYIDNLELSEEQLKSSECGDLVTKIMGKHTSYVSVVKECIELLRTFQSSNNLDFITKHMDEVKRRKGVKPRFLLIQNS